MPTTRISSIRLKTALPGPRSRELAARRASAVPGGVGHATPVYAGSARGALVTDVDGNVLIDFAGGIGTLNVGHANPEVVRAAAAQLERFTHTCFSVAPYEGYIALAEKLNAIAPGRGPKKTLLANSGAEALENAVKIARHATGREAVVVFEHAFHGRTLLTMSMTSKVRPYKYGFGPFAPEVYRLPFPYEYRGYRPGPRGVAADLEEFFKTQVAGEKVACVVLELVLGEGGFVVAPPDYVAALARACREHGILLVADEVQTGFGRTGKMFASEHYGIEPDLVTMAKSLAGGLPLSAVTGRAEVMDSAQVGGLGGTYAGNPVACAAALAAIEFLEKNRLPERAAEIGRAVAARFDGFLARYPFVGDARGLGAMRALEIVRDRATKEPDKDRTDRVLKKAYEAGLLLVGAGTHGNVIRTLMPLVVTDDELAEGLDVLDHALQEA
ncbi:MAG TPA: 4-aminobutyrate--2-oxoglutarate transaminase [Thermoanaerobaculia bacterium]|nr:4-aminobutyrate--2-oxoglutarate transaminase [Thermoanaerobaculia bacterium]